MFTSSLHSPPFTTHKVFLQFFFFLYLFFFALLRPRRGGLWLKAKNSFSLLAHFLPPPSLPLSSRRVKREEGEGGRAPPHSLPDRIIFLSHLQLKDIKEKRKKENQRGYSPTLKACIVIPIYCIWNSGVERGK